MTRLAKVLAAAALLPASLVWAKPPKQIEPRHVLKPPIGEGYFDDVFGLDADGKRVALIRTDGATFAKLEVYDIASGERQGGFNLPNANLVAADIELLAGNTGVVVIGRDRPDDEAPVYAFRFDGAGKPGGKVGPATAFGRPPADGTPRARLLIAFTRKLGNKGAEATFTVAPYDVTTLAPAGKARVHHVDVSGELKPPGVRYIGFYDGFTRMLSERPGEYDKKQDVRGQSKMAILDALTGKVDKEGPIADVVGWAQTGQLRQLHLDRSVFVELNDDASGVDVVDAMGKKQPATLAVPFHLYDPKSLRVEEGPEPKQLTFGIAIDPVNKDAVQRQKVDLPMLDVYSADVADGSVKLRGRVFTPRPVVWRARGNTLVVLKRFKSFSRGGDELQIYDLH
ncbi:MAG TPA: hypothetical protein VKQ32_23180 [Polyangia bacterium]|nr:hypothetical protein [Polyangia bacterium]